LVITNLTRFIYFHCIFFLKDVHCINSVRNRRFHLGLTTFLSVGLWFSYHQYYVFSLQIWQSTKAVLRGAIGMDLIGLSFLLAYQAGFVTRNDSYSVVFITAFVVR